jgi:HEAT repeat protein
MAATVTCRVALLGMMITALLVTGWNSAHGEEHPFLDQTDQQEIGRALEAIRMLPGDLGFKKDVADSVLVSPVARRLLHRPLDLPVHAQEWRVRAAAVTNLVSLLQVSGVLVDSQRKEERAKIDGLDRVPVPVQEAVGLLVQAGHEAAALLKRGLPKEMESPWAAVIADALTEQQVKDGEAEWKAAGFPLDRLQKFLDDAQNLRAPEDDTFRPLWTASQAWDEAAVRQAAAVMSHAVDEAIARIQKQRSDGAFRVEVDSDLGKIVCGGTGNDTYTDDAFLIIDLGGDDLYRCRAGMGSTLVGRPVSVVIDMAGNDQYVARKSFAQGTGVFGIGVLVDCGGDDIYAAEHFAQGMGLFGYGLLVDGGGNDTFAASSNAQGTGIFGLGALWQRGGDSRYDVRQMGQGTGGVGGVGVLVDGGGNDVYLAGGERACPWLPGQYFSMAQGFAIGMRPFTGGGTGVLCDLDGNDRYVSDVYGQGASYWYGVGMLIDGAGNDFYQAYQYCQGAGIHLSAGILADLAGDDQYGAQAICQGGAHDYSVGMLVDRAGNDRYTAATTAQGSAINNSFALLLDRAGNDFYAGRDPNQSQAAGHDGGKREYGSIALMLDLGGADVYSQGQSNQVAWIKPWYGAGVDCEATNAVASTAAFGTARTEDPAKSNDEGRSDLMQFRRADPDEPMEKLLRRAVSDRPDEAAAMEALKGKGAESLRYLVSRLDSPSVMVRVKAEEFVDALGAAAVPVLGEGLRDDRESVRRGCATFLARFGDNQSVSKQERAAVVNGLMPLLADEATITAALYALGHWHAREAYPAALSALRHEKELVRMRAAQALGRFGDRQAIPGLIEALGDPVWTVRYAAEGALVELGRGSIGPMRCAYAKATPVAKPHILGALARLGDRRALTWARILWRYEDPIWLKAEMRQLEESLPGRRGTILR